MEALYITLIAILFVLAISDLVVGVSNDAVNFLNSAIGVKVAKLRTIMIVAALGIFVGATFSNGMMEVARSGIFHPQQFYFNEIMIIFLSVMIADVILLDLFNTFGMPTSTTVSIVFELFGAAVAISLFKIAGDDGGTLGQYINSEKALAIISGILLSIIIAFTIGAIIQWIIRFIFSFNFDRTYKWFGAIWGGFSITSIVYFLLIKGAKGSSLITPDILHQIESNTLTILISCFAAFTIVLQLLVSLFRVNILRIIVLVGTFALAMAFAGNDLVNFIGVPLAGLASFKAFIAGGGISPDSFTMEALTDTVQTPTSYLLIAGAIMVITLWTSKKARSVTKTSLDLGRQEEGDERFQSSAVARILVRMSVSTSNLFSRVMPAPAKQWIHSRFDVSKAKESKYYDPTLSFDLIRASANLVVASILIAFATSLKLPLSTTYVTFMVAMGSSLSDKAWDRESAVYRITGVLTVVAGWFFTAFSAFTLSFVLASIIYWGGVPLIFLLCTLAVFAVVKTQLFFRKKQSEISKENKIRDTMDDSSILETCCNNLDDVLAKIDNIYERAISGLIKEKRSRLKKALKETEAVSKQTKGYKNNVHYTIDKLEQDSVETGHYYVQVVDYLRKISKTTDNIIRPIFTHVDNNHKPLLSEQQKDISEVQQAVSNYINTLRSLHSKGEFKCIKEALKQLFKIKETLNGLKKKQLKMIKKKVVGTRNSMLYLELIEETKNLLTDLHGLIKAERDFVNYKKK